MAYEFLLDRLPVGLLHSLFTYFLAHQLLFSFSEVSDYVNTALISYAAYQMDLKSIRRVDFDFVCRRIRPEQIISLILSDDHDTPGQTELFFSRFRLEEFTHLRSLTLNKIEFESLECILVNLDKLKQLKSLSFNNDIFRSKHPLRFRDDSDACNQMNLLLSNSLSLIFPQLDRLHLNMHVDFRKIRLSNLRHLKLERCFIDDLNPIFQNVPQLKSLDVGLYIEKPIVEMNLTSSQLIRLKLVIKLSYRISMNLMVEFLSNLPNLKHFELILNCDSDFVDGQRWEMLTKSFRTFDFKFYLPFDVKPDDLHSFQTSYWLVEKCWQVVGGKCCLFTIPHFAPNHVEINKWSDEWPIESINTIYINAIPINPFPRYLHIKKLYLNRTLSRPQILSMIELKELECLSILSLDDLLIFAPFESTIPNLYELTVKNTVAFHMIDQLQGCQLKQMRKLFISISNKNTELILQELLYVFSQIEYLRYASDVCSMETMIHLIDRFAYLTNASFYSKHLSSELQSDLHSHSNQLTQNNVTYRIECSLNNQQLHAVHWWIDAQVSLSHIIEPAPTLWGGGGNGQHCPRTEK